MEGVTDAADAARARGGHPSGSVHAEAYSDRDRWPGEEQLSGAYRGRCGQPGGCRGSDGDRGAGAERLLGQGDFLVVAKGQVTRMQAAYAGAGMVREMVGRLGAGSKPLLLAATGTDGRKRQLEPLAQARAAGSVSGWSSSGVAGCWRSFGYWFFKTQRGSCRLRRAGQTGGAWAGRGERGAV